MDKTVYSTEKGKALWLLVGSMGGRCYLHGSAWHTRRAYANLSELLGLGKHGGLTHMLRMSEVDEACVQGKTSAYDQLKVLCEVLPLWAGHPYYYAIHELLRRVFDIHEPLSMVTLPAVWKETARILFEKDITPEELLKLWNVGRGIFMLSPEELEELSSEQPLPSQSYVYLSDLGRCLWTSASAPVLSSHTFSQDMSRYVDQLVDQYVREGVSGVAIDLSALSAFIRPDPYRPAQVVMKLQAGKNNLSSEDDDRIITQTLRLLGRACADQGLKFLLLHPRPDVAVPLCKYLYESNCLPATDLATDVPEILCAEHLQGNIRQILTLPHHMPPEMLKSTVTRISAQMPIGKLGGLFLPVSEPIDLPLWENAGQSFCQCVTDFGNMLWGTHETSEQLALVKGILT